MRLSASAHFKKDYQELPSQIKKKVEKQLKILAQNLSHPSLRVKKMKGYGGLQLWEARIDRFWRISFQKMGDEIRLYRLGPHDKVVKNK